MTPARAPGGTARALISDTARRGRPATCHGSPRRDCALPVLPVPPGRTRAPPRGAAGTRTSTSSGPVLGGRHRALRSRARPSPTPTAAPTASCTRTQDGAKFLNRSAGHGGQTAHRPRCALSSCSAVIVHRCGRRSRHQAGPPESAGFGSASTLLAAVSGRRSRAAGPSPCITVLYPALAHGVCDGRRRGRAGPQGQVHRDDPRPPALPDRTGTGQTTNAVYAPRDGRADGAQRPRSRAARRRHGDPLNPRRARWIGQTAVARQINRTSGDRGQGDNLSASREINSPPRGNSARPLTAWSRSRDIDGITRWG